LTKNISKRAPKEYSARHIFKLDILLLNAEVKNSSRRSFFYILHPYTCKFNVNKVPFSAMFQSTEM